MAIEFDCPRCSATIRVPDAYSGRQGRCPQCNERLLVPLVAVPDASAQVAVQHSAGFSAQAPPAGPSFSSGPPRADVSSGPVMVVAEMSVPAAPVGAAVPGPAVAVADASAPAAPASASGAVGLPVGPGAGSSASPRRGRSKTSRFNRRRPSRALVIGIPAIGFLLLLAILALSIPGGPELQGELKGRLLVEKSLPRTVVPWSDAGVSGEQQQALQAALTENPETFSSELLVCRVLGTASGLEIQLTAATGARWCAVNLHDAGQKALALWLKQQRVRLGEQRRAEMIQTLSAWCQDKLRQINGEQITIDAAGARDNGVLTATVDSLGYAVQARAGKRLLRAAAEDDTGWLYFCVPADTESLVVEGRSHETSGLLFPGRYEVTFDAAPAAPAAPSAKAASEPSAAGDADGPEMQKAPGNESGMEGAEESPSADGTDSGEKSMQKQDAFGGAMKGMFRSEMTDEESMETDAEMETEMKMETPKEGSPAMKKAAVRGRKKSTAE
ncbi:MAG: hypothetical protein ACKO2P_15765 [Planctomycetota bacterium]